MSLLLSALLAGDIDGQLPVTVPCGQEILIDSCRRHALHTSCRRTQQQQRSAANVGSVMLTAVGRG